MSSEFWIGVMTGSTAFWLGYYFGFDARINWLKRTPKQLFGEPKAAGGLYVDDVVLPVEDAQDNGNQDQTTCLSSQYSSATYQTVNEFPHWETIRCINQGAQYLRPHLIKLRDES